MTQNPTETHDQPRVLFFECVGGVSGDMCLGALIDLGFPQEALLEGLSQLGLDDRCEILVESCTVGVVCARRVHIRLTQSEDRPRHLGQIRELIRRSGLAETVQLRALRIFERLAEAEASVHGTGPEDIHFHEVGAIDAIIDIVGTSIAIDYFAPDEIWHSPFVTGRGTVECAHGVIPVPAPAVMNLALGNTIRYLDVNAELTTPTGAAILTAVGRECAAPEIRLERVGYGTGHHEIPGVLNLLRVSLGTRSRSQAPLG